MTTNNRFPQLHDDAPPVPHGLRPKIGVEYGCGDATCTDCYEDDPLRTLCTADTLLQRCGDSHCTRPILAGIAAG
jgi:hypothetical protein